MGLLVGAVLGLLAVGGVVLASRRGAGSSSGGSGGSGGGAADKGNIRQRTQAKVNAKERADANPLFAGGKSAKQYAAIGLAAGGPFAPFTAAIGWIVGSLVDALGLPSYARLTRDACAQWLRDNGFPHSSAAVDAMLWRNALLGMRHVYRNVETGEVAVEVTGKDAAGWNVSAFGGVLDQELVGGYAGTHVRQQLMGWSDGMLDGPNQRRDDRALKAKLAAGQLLPVVYIKNPPQSWRTPGYVWLYDVWPRVARPDPHAVAKSPAWERVEPSSANVDQLAAPFDAAAGVEMVQA